MNSRILSAAVAALISVACAGETFEQPADQAQPEPSSSSAARTLSVECPDGAPSPVHEGAIFCACAGGETLVSGFSAGDSYCVTDPATYIASMRYASTQDGCIDILSDAGSEFVTVHGKGCFYPGK